MLLAEKLAFFCAGMIASGIGILIFNLGLRIAGYRIIPKRLTLMQRRFLWDDARVLTNYEYEKFKKQHEDQLTKDTKED